MNVIAGKPPASTPLDTPPAPAHPRDTPARTLRQPGWRSLDVLRAAALVMGLYLFLRLLWIARELIFISFLGILFGLAVARGTDYLERMKIPRGIGASLIVLGVLGLLYGVGAWSAPTLQGQFTELRRKLPEAVNRAEGWLNQRRSGLLGDLIPPGLGTGASQGDSRPAAGAPPAAPAAQDPGAQAPAQPEEDSQLSNTLANQLGSVAGYLFSFLSSTLAVLGGMLLIIFLAIYIGASPGLYHKGLLHLIPHRARSRASEVLSAIGDTLRRWLVTQLIAMVVIGTITTVLLMLLDVEAALSLGIIAGLLEFIPMVGPFLAAIPAVAMGFLDSPQKALMVVLAYTLIQFIENHLLIPILMKRGVDLPPALTLIGLALMGLVFGFIGMLVAVPALAAIMVAVKLLYVEDVVGDEAEAG
jgi:predicted PurR-regulated permease PerM